MSRGGSRPITIAAMLAADCSELPSRLRHLIHVLALHADNATGIGLTGQERLARYMGISSRQVRRLLGELEEAWANGSPVGILREKRWLNSDRYRLVVRQGALLELPRLQNDRTPMSAHRRTPMSGMTGHRRPVDRTPMSAPVPNEPDTSGLQSTEVALQSNPPSKKTLKVFPGGPPTGPAERGPTEAELLGSAAPREARLAQLEQLRSAATRRR